MIKIANPADKEWQGHFAASYGGAADRIGFDGLRIHTYGYPRSPLDANGQPVDFGDAYEGFLTSFRAADDRPGQLQPGERRPFGRHAAGRPRLSLRRGVGAQRRMAPPRGLDGPERRQGGPPGPGLSEGPMMRGTIACYPPVGGTTTRTGL